MDIKKVTLVGYYGYDNLGDDIMLESLFQGIESSISFIKIDLLAKKSNNILSMVDRFDFVNFIELKRNSKYYNFKSYLKSIYTSDLTIWGGGTCFSDEDGIGNFKYFILNTLLKKPFAYVGIGIGNLDKIRSKYLTKILLNRMAFATFRDRVSYDFALKMSENKNIFLTSDLSYSFKYEPSKGNKKKPYILVSLRNLSNFYSREDLNKRHDVIVNFISKVSTEQNKEVYFLPIDSVKDMEINKVICGLLNKSNENIKASYINCTSTEEKIDLIYNAEMNISERLHSLVISNFHGRKCIGLSYSPKIERFFFEVGSTSMISHKEKLKIEKLLSLYNQEYYSVDNQIIEEKRVLSLQNLIILKEYLCD